MAYKDKKLTVESSLKDFERAYRAKRKLIERQKDDHLFRLGKQWDPEIAAQLKAKNILPVTDNRIQPNIFLITGLERQNRSDLKAFPEGEEDTTKAAVATALFKDSIKKSDFGYKKSEAFEDGIVCGESHLELYLDDTYNIVNLKPCWKKIDSSQVFPEPGWKEYDYSDAGFLYKLTVGLSTGDMIGLFPDKEKKIEKVKDGKIDFKAMVSEAERSVQPRDYGKTDDTKPGEAEECVFDLIERYYKKLVSTSYIADRKTGEVKESQASEEMDGEEQATSFVQNYQNTIIQADEQYQSDLMTYQMGQVSPQIDEMGQPLPPAPAPLEPPQQDPERFYVFKRKVPEIWYFAHVAGMAEPLADERAASYPKWKSWPIIPYFAHYSTAPIDGEDSHLKVQGLVYGVKGVQDKHNKAETLKVLHLQSSVNSGWLTEEDSWVDPTKVQALGAQSGANLEYKKGLANIPQRLTAVPLSQAHTQIAAESAEAIKAILGINADLLAAQEGGQSSGRAIALRQRQSLVMVQKLFDNLSRTTQICARFLLSQLGEIYDTESAKKVLGESFLIKNFPPVMEPVMDEMTGEIARDPMSGQPQTAPRKGPDGQPQKYDTEMADFTIAEVLSGDLGQYDVTVGESVASETMLMAQQAEVQEMAQLLPMAFTPDMIIEGSNIPKTMKSRAISNAQAFQASQQQMQAMPAPQKTAPDNPLAA